MACWIFPHEFEKFVQFDITPTNGHSSIDCVEDDENLETHKRTITGFFCRKCGFVKNYTHNFTRNKEAK